MLQFLRPVPELLTFSPPTSFPKSCSARRILEKKNEIQIRHIVTRLFRDICFLNRNDHYDEYIVIGIKVNIDNLNLFKRDCF